jgi:hypothetical protein
VVSETLEKLHVRTSERVASPARKPEGGFIVACSARSGGWNARTSGTLDDTPAPPARRRTEWAHDQERRKRTAVPEEVEMRTKPELA